jgi:uncharacterized DUF497 family protein
MRRADATVCLTGTRCARLIAVKYFDWDDAKNVKLQAERGIGFEEIVFYIERGVPHDFRRTAIRNLERDGVPRSVAMAMVGQKTEEVYRRYAIVDEAMIREAAAKMNRGAKGRLATAHEL